MTKMRNSLKFKIGFYLMITLAVTVFVFLMVVTRFPPNHSNSQVIIGFALGFVVLGSLLMAYLVHRLVDLPLRDLEEGAVRVAKGDLKREIPVRSSDEIGQLASSFNSMTRALQKSQSDLESWGHILEQNVEDAKQEVSIAHTETARSEKLASVGLLAARIAHELNSPLTGMLTVSSMVRKNLPDGSRDAQDLDLVIRETRRCAAIIHRLLDFSREKAPEKTFCNLNKLIAEAAELIEQASHTGNVEIITVLDEQLPAVWIDENLISQVIMNMLVNAQHAIEDRGRITIKTHFFSAHDRPESIATSGSVAEITIADTGCGISRDDLLRIFDPFFTTKDIGEGTGLGLSVSHGTIEAHGGVIEVESIVGKGSEFRIYLPIGGKIDQAKSV